MKKKIKFFILTLALGVIAGLSIFGIAMSYTNPWIEDTWTGIPNHPCPQVWQDWYSGGYGGYAHYAPTGGLYRATRHNELSFYLTAQGGSGRVGYFPAFPYNGTRYWIDRNFDGTVDKYPNDNTGWGNTWNDNAPGWGPEYFYVTGASINSQLPGGSSFWISALYDYKGETFDENGYTSNYYYITFAVDKKPPTISITSPVWGQKYATRNFTANGSSNDPTQNVIWGGIKKLWWAIYTEGGSQISGTYQEYSNSFSSMPQTQPWSRAMSLPAGYNDGKYYVKGACSDGVGNWSSTFSQFIQFDFTGPNCTLSMTPPALSNNNNPKLEFAVEDLLVGGVQSDINVGQYSVYRASDGYCVKGWTNGTQISGSGHAKGYRAYLGPLSDGTYYAKVRGQDIMGNWSTGSQIKQTSNFKIDSTAPAIAITSPSNGTWTNQNPITVTGTAEVGSYVWVSGQGEWIAYGICSTGSWSKPVPMSGGDPYTTVSLKAKATDNAGNIGYSSTVTIYYDGKKPSGSIIVNSGNAYTATANVSLALSAQDPNGSGVNNMMISNSSSFSGASWQSYATSKSWTLASGDGTKYVYVKYTDKAGNISDDYSDSIVLDTVAPTGSISINSGAIYATSKSIVLTNAGSDATSGVNDMCFSENGTSYTSWESFNTQKLWTLSGADGTRSMYIKLKDKAGNTSGPFSDSIILDTLAPTGTILIDGGAIYTTSDNVTLTLSASDATSGINEMCFSNDCSVYSEWQSYGTSKNWTLSDGDGEKAVYVKYKDKAGNISNAYPEFIIKDTVSPTGSILISDGADYVSTREVNLTLGCEDETSGPGEMKFSNDGISYSEWESFAKSKGWNLTEGDGVKTVYVKYRDKAGNEIGAFTDTIILKSENPSILITSPQSDFWTNNSEAQIKGTSELNSHIYVKDENSVFHNIGLLTTTTNWSAQIPMVYKDPYKDNHIVAKAVDLAGNTTYSNEIVIYYDNIVPNPPHISAPQDGLKTSNKNQVISGSCEKDSIVIIYNNSAEITRTTDTTSGTFSVTKTLEDASYRLRATSTDIAGNISNFSDFVEILIDNELPARCSVKINDDAEYTNKSVVSLTLNSDDVRSGVTSMIVGNDASFTGRSWEAYAKTKTWTLTSGDGEKTVYAKFKDGAGNESKVVSDSIILDTTPDNPPPPPDNPTNLSNAARYGGPDRYDTAIELSRLGFPNAAQSVTIARGDLFPDALTGVALAKKYNGPILLNHPSPSGLEKRVASEINRLKAKEAFILGTEDAVSNQLVEDLTSECHIENKNIHRLGGATRYETSAEIARIVSSPSKKAIIVTGENYPDALAISSFSALNNIPILLVSFDEIKAEVQKVLQELSINQIIIVGANDVVSDGVVGWLTSNKYSLLQRLGGADRYETSVLVADFALTNGLSNKCVFMATGRDFPDALCAGAIAGMDSYKAPIALVVTEGVPGVVENWLKQNLRGGFAYLTGTNDVINDTTMMKINNILAGF